MLTVYYYQSLHAPKLSCVFVDVNASVLRFWRVGACPCVEACRRKCWRVWRRFRQLVSGWTRFEACTRRRLTARLGAVSVFTLIVIAFYCQLSCVDMNNVIQYCPRNRFVSSVSAATVNTAVSNGASTHPDAQSYSFFLDCGDWNHTPATCWRCCVCRCGVCWCRACRSSPRPTWCHTLKSCVEVSI